MKNLNPNTENSIEWLTPPEIVKACGEFDLDPCSPIDRPWDTAKKHYTIRDDGFNKEWHGRVWLNPPYGLETFKWVKRLADHGNGIALIFARTETKGFHAQVWRRAHSLLFLKGRLKFYRPDGSKGKLGAGAPSVLISYSPFDTECLRQSGLGGCLVTVD